MDPLLCRPPDGNMGDYLASLEKLTTREEVRYWPTHGPAIENPRPFVHAFINHREKRETQISECLAAGRTNITDIVKDLYAGVDSRLHRAAARSVLAHLIHMVESGRAKCDGVPHIDGVYRSPKS